MVVGTYTVSVSLIRVLSQYASDIGVEWGLTGTYEALGLTPEALEDPKTRISLEGFNALWREVARRAGDPNFGLHLGQAARRFWGGDVMSGLTMNCPTLGDAMQKLCRYHPITTDFVQLALRQRGDVADYAWTPVAQEVSLERHHSEAVLSTLAFILRRLTQGQIQFVEARFMHLQPDDVLEHRRIFRCPLAFGCPDNALVLKREDLDRPILLANPELLARMEHLAQELLARLYRPDTWAERVTRVMSRMLWQGEKPTLNAVARELAISPRHLQNKLKAEATTYRALFDQLRQEIAQASLQDPTVTLCDVALLLGFSGQSAFNHAFKRWTGLSPMAYRQRDGR